MQRRCSQLEIRRVELADVSELVELCREHAEFEQAFVVPPEPARLRAALLGSPPRLHGWIALLNSDAVGYATATVDFSTWRACDFMHMDCLFVRTSARNAGIGRQLLDAVRADARALGITHIEWQTPDWNLDAQRFYARAGARAAPKVRFTLEV